MEAGQTPPADRMVAAVVAIAANAALAWCLVDALSLPAPAASGPPLQLYWVAAPASIGPATALPPPPHPAAPAPPAPTRADPVQAPPSTEVEFVAARPPAPAAQPDIAIDAATAYLRQLRRHGEDAMAGQFGKHDPLAPPPARVPGRHADHFRMAEPASVAAALEKVGKLVAGSNYVADGCGELAEDVRLLAFEGDSRVLRDALDRQRRQCR